MLKESWDRGVVCVRETQRGLVLSTWTEDFQSLGQVTFPCLSVFICKMGKHLCLEGFFFLKIRQVDIFYED